jgi:hypothetical protein
VLADGGQGVARQQLRLAGLQRGLAGQERQELHRRAGGQHDLRHRLADFGTDAIARNEHDFVRHELFPPQELPSCDRDTWRCSLSSSAAFPVR